MALVRWEPLREIERATGAFSRSLTLPEGVDADAIAASFDRGVLEIRIPKPEQRKPRRVQISLGEEQPAIEGTAEAGNGNSAQATAGPASLLGCPACPAPFASSPAIRARRRGRVC